MKKWQQWKPTIVVLMAGSAIDLNYAQEKCNGILLAWYPGARGGKAVADLLFGNVSPSGKLPVTFYKDLEGMPEFTDYTMKGRDLPLYRERAAVSIWLWTDLWRRGSHRRKTDESR